MKTKLKKVSVVRASVAVECRTGGEVAGHDRSRNT